MQKKFQNATKSTFRHAAKLAPEDIPTSNPSSIASLLACVIASSVDTVITSSM